MKRALSVILTLAMLLSMFAVMFVTNVAAATVISNTSPAITADVGETIDLSTYSVTFDGDTSATSGITWKNGSNTITTFKPTAKGVTELTAISGSKTKTIYVVAKEASETEYVLYEANMADFATTQSLIDAGWKLYGTTSSADTSVSFSKASDGALVIETPDLYGTVHAYLPTWLGDFGDYGFEADVKILSTVNNNTGRWLGIMHRANNLNAVSHYSHMAIREAANGASGVEYGERYYADDLDGNANTSDPGDTWNVLTRTSASNSTMSDIYRTARVEAFGKTVSCSLQSKQMLYISDVTTALKKFDQKGYLGLIMCGGELAIKRVKVTVQESAPEEVPTDLSLIYNNNHDTDNLLNPIANVQRVDGTNLTAGALKDLTIAFFNANDADVTKNMQTCVDAGVVPTIYVATNAQADNVVAAVNAVGICDVNVVSSSVSVLKYIRGKNSAIRTGLRKDISTYMTDGTLTDVEANEIRIEVRSAPATFVVIDSEHATKQAVSEIQKLAVSVWATFPANDTRTQADHDLEIINCITAGVNGIITRDAINVNTVVNNTFADNSMTRTPLIIGHRGNPSVAPENTIESFQAAYDNGADVFELDVNRTKDGVIVVLHDDTLARTTTYNGTTPITSMTWAQAQQYHVLELDGVTSTGKPIPTLDEVVKWAKGKDIKLFVEFKWGVETSIAPTMQIISTNSMNQQVDVISFTGSYCTATQNATPGMSTGLLMSSYSDEYGNITASTYALALSQVDTHITTAQKYNSTVNLGSYSNQFTHYTAQAITDRGQTAWPWTYNQTNTGAAFVMGFDGITTDYVELVKDMPKTLLASDFYMCVGQTYNGADVKVESHGNAVTATDSGKLISKVVYGDAVAVENGKLVAKKSGSAQVIFGYVAETYDGREYVLYTEPVTVTVDSMGALKSLVALAKEVTVKDFNAADLKSIRTLCETADGLISSNSTDNDKIMETALALSELLNRKFGSTVSDVTIGSYDTTDSNYYAWDSSIGGPSTTLDERYIDDHKCLMDGIKNSADTESAAYDVWQNVDTEITVDLGAVKNSNIFSIYAAEYSPYAIYAPKGLEVSYKDASGNWITVPGDLEIVQTGTSGDWTLHKLTLTTDTAINAQHVKIKVIRDGIFVWMDEFEVGFATGGRVSGNYIYVTDMDSLVEAGDSTVFTEGTVTAAGSNHKYTCNIEAEWSDFYKAYVVTAVTEGSGETTPSVTVGDGKILVAVHPWPEVVGSTENNERAKAVTVGQLLVPNGMDISGGTIGIAPYFTVIDSDHECKASGSIQHNESTHWYVCECGEKVGEEEHEAGKWVIDTPASLEDPGSKSKTCVDCGTVLETEEIPQLQPDHSHEAVGGWASDEKGHWHECSCGNDLDYGEHKAGDWTASEEEGKEVQLCSVCGYVMNTRDADTDFILGDVNRSGAIDMMDYILLKRNYFGTFKFDDDQLKRGDVNHSGAIDMMDYILLKRAYFGTFVLQ